MSARVCFAVGVQVSDDPDFIMDVETNEGKLIDAKGIDGRYVRLHSRGKHSQ